MPGTLELSVIVLLTLLVLSVGLVLGYIIGLGEKVIEEEPDINDDEPAIFDSTPEVVRDNARHNKGIDDEESAIITAKTPKQIKTDKERKVQAEIDKTVENYK